MAEKIIEILEEMQKCVRNRFVEEKEKVNVMEKVENVKQMINDFFETKYDTDEVFTCFCYLKKLFSNFEETDICFFFAFFNHVKKGIVTHRELIDAIKSYLIKTENIDIFEMKQGDLIIENMCKIIEIDKVRKVKNNNWSAYGHNIQTGLKHKILLSWLRRHKIIEHDFDDVKDINMAFVKVCMWPYVWQ